MGEKPLCYALCSRLDSKGYTLAGVIQVAALPNKEKIEWILSDQGSGESRFLMGIEQQANLRNFVDFLLMILLFNGQMKKLWQKLMMPIS